jgi:hypothetical protein
MGHLTPGCSGPGARFARTSAAEPDRWTDQREHSVLYPLE